MLSPDYAAQVKVDAERYVDLKEMMQKRYDDPAGRMCVGRPPLACSPPPGC